MNKIEMIQNKDFIANSHKRCEEYQVEKDRVYSKRIITGDELFQKLEAKRELIDTAGLYLNQLYNFVKGSNFFSLLTDEDGCILSIIGDDEILSEAFSYKMVPGAYMDERNIGTNAMGTTLAERMPVQISGDQHYITAYHRWTCSASPIRNPKGKIIGSIDLTGYSESVNLHTLGMVVAAANAIEEILDIKQYAEDLAMEKKFTETILESIDSGIMTTDLDGNVITVNKHIEDMLGYSADGLRQMNIRNLMEDWEKIRSCIMGKQSFSNTDMFVNSKRKKLQYNVSAYPHLDDNQKIRNVVLVFQEVKKIRRLANKIMGHQALYTFDKLKGQDENFIRIIEYAKKIADSRSNVLIMGESGTGKELFAQAIHNYCSRHDEPFVALNCGAIPRNLIETELFGYEGGAFTGSKSAGQPGKFEIADGGTIFLDEIGEMPLDLQTRLLRVIEEGTVSRVGSVKEVKVDVRVIAATNKDLSEEVRCGNFRTDLFYRLNVLPIRLLPLRDRKTDIPLLSRYFMDVISKRLGKHAMEIDTETMKALVKYEWPGNVRELENVIEQMINTQSIPEGFVKQEKASPAISVEPEQPLPYKPIALEQYEDVLNLEAMERSCITKALDLYRGNISLCARALGIGRNTLYRKMDTYGIKCTESDQRPNLS